MQRTHIEATTSCFASSKHLDVSISNCNWKEEIAVIRNQIHESNSWPNVRLLGEGKGNWIQIASENVGKKRI